MGQYFSLVNLDKREYVCPWCIGGGAKLWEWAANSTGAVATILLRKSDEGGGGDYYGYKRGNSEGGPITPPLSAIVGRWAGDRIAFVGDYDSSKLWDELPKWQNISKAVVETWNDFIELPDKKIGIPFRLRTPLNRTCPGGSTFGAFFIRRDRDGTLSPCACPS